MLEQRAARNIYDNGDNNSGKDHFAEAEVASCGKYLSIGGKNMLLGFWWQIAEYPLVLQMRQGKGQLFDWVD